MRLLVPLLATALLGGCASPYFYQAPTGNTWSVSPSIYETSQDSCAMRKGDVVVSISEMNFITDVRKVGIITAHTEYGLYPRSQVVVIANGEQASGQNGVSLTESQINVLGNYDEMVVGWRPWPTGGQREQRITMTGYDEALVKCKEALGWS